MDIKTLELSAAILFALIALIGGGFTVKEIRIPSVPSWARFASGLLGVLFLLLFVAPWEEDRSKPFHYEWRGTDTSKHGLALVGLTAKSASDPPRLMDAIEVHFSLRNATGRTIRLAQTFVVGRDPYGNNRDFGGANEDRDVLPGEVIHTTGVIVVDIEGVWVFGPSYDLGNEVYPGEWHRFPVRVGP